MLIGTAAAGGIALINVVGNAGGYVGPALAGYIRNATQSYAYGLLALGGFAVMAAVLLVALGRKPATELAQA